MKKGVRTKIVNTPLPTLSDLEAELKSNIKKLNLKKAKSPRTGLIERNAPERDVYGNLCGPYVGKKRKQTDKALPSCSASNLPEPNILLHDVDVSVEGTIVGLDNNEGVDTCTLREAALPKPRQQQGTEVEKLLKLIEEAKTLGLIPTDPKRNYVPHAERKERAEEDWSSLRPALLAAILSKCGFCVSSEFICSNSKCEAGAHVSCMDCKSSFCHECDIIVHDFVCSSWHRRSTTISGYEVPLQPYDVIAKGESSNRFERKVTSNRYVDVQGPCICLHCDGISFHKETHGICAYITTKGRLDMYIPKFVCTSCGMESKVSVSDLVVNDLWPGSPSVSSGMYIFEADVLRWYHFLKMESPSLSRRSFLAALEQFSRIQGNLRTISPQPFKTAYNEWQYCQFALETMSGAEWMDCPACFDGIHAVHLDGNKKLYRFKGQNQTSTQNHFGDVFIVKDKEVDEFVKEVKKIGEQGTSTCGETHWKAARSQSKQHRALAETGMEIAVCRHAHILKSLNMFQGEIYAYPMFLHKLLDKMTKLDFVCQDIICKYWPYLLRILPSLADDNHQTLVRNTKPFLSVFHATAHDWTCQVIWGGRWQKGSGAQAGEEAEQANSYLSRASFTTKTMDKSGREEQLTAHALYWNRKKVTKLPRYLAQRYKKCFSKIDKLEKELSEALEKSNVCRPKYNDWKTEVQEFAQAVISGRSERRRNVNSACDPSALDSMRVEIEVYASNIKQLKCDISKSADSSKKRGHLRQKMEKEKKKLAVVIELYNSKADAEAIDIENITKEDYVFPWEQYSGNSSLSYTSKKNLVDIHEHICRYEEEKIILIHEMKAVTSYLTNRVVSLKEWLKLADRSPAEFADYLQKNDEAYHLTTVSDKVIRGAVVKIRGTMEFYTDLLVESSAIFRAVTDDSESFDTLDIIFCEDEEDNDNIDEDEDEDVDYDDVDYDDAV